MHFRVKTALQKSIADTTTPVGIYLKIRDHFQECILLENSEYGIKENHFSFICCRKMAGITLKNNAIHLHYPDGEQTVQAIVYHEQVKEVISAFSDQFLLISEDIPDNIRGLFGYFNYDAVVHFEDIQLHTPIHPDKEIADVRLSFYKFIIVFDHFKNEISIAEHYLDHENPEGTFFLDALIRNAHLYTYPFHLTEDESSNFTDQEFLDLIKLGKGHCLQGDVFQIVLSRAFSQAYKGDDFMVYRALRSINPSPYLFYCDYGDYRIFGSSPEAQLRVNNAQASIHPIAGTYRKSDMHREDGQELSVRLQGDKKENAEHVMLVDLARNDLSKRYKKVVVHADREIQHFSHVIHLVSEVRGTQAIADDINAIEIFGDSFPAGTLSGAPKFKAMQLIDRYENSKRGFYGGSIGFIGFNGNVNHAIMIRSFLSRDNKLHYQAGAGIVAQSVVENELQEINHKLAALRKALVAAQNI